MKIKKDKILISICLVVLIGYFLILFKLICLKYLSISGILPHLERNNYFRPYNLVPFASIKFYVLYDSMPLLRRAGNIFGNIALFIPIGLFFPLIFRNARKILPVFMLSVLLSASFELFQYKLGTGSADIDDVILNALGGLSGFFIFLILKTKFKSEARTMIASLTFFFILFITGGLFASLEFRLDLGFMTGGNRVEIKRRILAHDTTMVIPVRNADMEGKLEEVSGDTLKINKIQIIRDNNANKENGTIIMVMNDIDKSSNPLTKVLVSKNTYVLRKDVIQYSTTQFDIQYSISRLDSIPMKCDVQIWKAHPDSIHADTLCYRVVYKR